MHRSDASDGAEKLGLAEAIDERVQRKRSPNRTPDLDSYL
jgi:hypothetical protein